MHRFFVDPELLVQIDLPVLLPEKIAHQVRDVLHLAVGERLALLDNSGTEFIGRVTKSGRDGVEVAIEEWQVGKGTGNVRIVLCQGLLKSARFEWILEKGTELGVSTFIPTLCSRSLSGLEDAGAAKLQRWQRIIQEATEQCGRAQRPELLAIRPLSQVLTTLPADALTLIPWEEEHDISLRTALRTFHEAQSEPEPAKTARTVVLFIGPEGGLTPEEIDLARRYGVQPVSLGPRILRAETAALSAVANVMYELA
jgi:16S rRNA (uracil1498-N3)-methyltransferase